jgi:hypothetical protein
VSKRYGFPLFVSIVDSRISQLRTFNTRGRGRIVFDALGNRRWVSDLKGALTVDLIFEHLQLWDFLENFKLQPYLEDTVDKKRQLVSCMTPHEDLGDLLSFGAGSKIASCIFKAC